MNKRHSEKGFTLIEVLITIGIMGAIMGVMSMTIIMFLIAGPESNDRTVAIRQVQNAGYWISRDVTGAGTITVDGDPATPEFITLTIPLSSSDNETVLYEFEDMAGGLKKLVRTNQDSGNQILIAEYIYYDPNGDPGNSTKVISYVSPVLKLQITSVSGGATIIKEYEATQRVPSG